MRPTIPPPQAMLFDLDDTLWPIAPVIERAELALHDWLAEHAPAVPRRFSIEALRQRRADLLLRQPALGADLAALRRAGLREAFRHAGEDEAKVDAAMRHFLAARNAVTLYDDVLPALRELGRRLPLGSITNGNADLDAIGLAPHFRVSLAAARCGRPKPDPAMFHAACAALGVAPAAAVYVGDDLLLDVAAAQRAGLRAVWLNRRGGDARLAAGVVPDAICAGLGELLDWLARQTEE